MATDNSGNSNGARQSARLSRCTQFKPMRTHDLNAADFRNINTIGALLGFGARFVNTKIKDEPRN